MVADFEILPESIEVNSEVMVALGYVDISSGVIFECEWDFGDGSAANHGPYAWHRYSTPGQKRITLTLTSDRGVVYKRTRNILVDALERGSVPAR